VLGEETRRLGPAFRDGASAVRFCTAGERKHLIAEQYLEENSVSHGVFLILAARTPASVWKVHRSARGHHPAGKEAEHVYYYSFHNMDQVFGHLVIKMSGHPPLGGQVISTGTSTARSPRRERGSGSRRRGTVSLRSRICSAWPGWQMPGRVRRAIGRSGQVCDRWIYSACPCSGLDLAEQERSRFRYGYSVYQAEYSRNLLLSPVRR
jgi:hypothetical protein